MDFGEILDAWERRQKDKKQNRAVRKTPPDRSASRNLPKIPPPVSPQRAHPLAVWLSQNEVYDKDANGGQDANGGMTFRGRSAEKRRLRAKKSDDEIDLHGLTRDEAWDRLDAFFANARREGFEKLLIIHGKGNHSSGEAVLKRLVRAYLERSPYAAESGHGNAAEGGSGATWVLLRQGDKGRPA
ncbi:MAG: Smr/MutS family protein [Spirochaetaceae bacterium]|jgi:DNA-nicking Smr family endonuclease|nr:Smr/MutS family protein [Spirochaetaceae bacterium]